MTRKLWALLAGLLLLTAVLVGVCSSGETKTEAATKKAKDYSKLVASEDEMIAIDKVIKDGMVPIEGKSIKDGEYDITVASSSAMFNINACKLIVKKGEMTALMTMGGTGYEYLFMGSGEEAVDADGKGYISYEETADGKNTFTVPVEVLDGPVKCAAFSKKKQKWYNRTLCFHADSIPVEAFSEDVVKTAKSLGLEDGSYTIDAGLGGGSGRAELENPTKMTVKDGKAVAVLTWSSSYYDYMIVDGQRYDPINTDGNSQFEIPVKAFDLALNILADTTRMSQPYEIEYVLKFDSSTIEKQGGEKSTGGNRSAFYAVLIALLLTALVVFFVHHRKTKGREDHGKK